MRLSTVLLLILPALATASPFLKRQSEPSDIPEGCRSVCEKMENELSTCDDNAACYCEPQTLADFSECYTCAIGSLSGDEKDQVEAALAAYQQTCAAGGFTDATTSSTTSTTSQSTSSSTLTSSSQSSSSSSSGSSGSSRSSSSQMSTSTTSKTGTTTGSATPTPTGTGGAMGLRTGWALLVGGVGASIAFAW